jgi:hypothetical protein
VSTQIYTNLQLPSCVYTNLQLSSCVYTNLQKSAVVHLCLHKSTQICSCQVVSTQICSCPVVSTQICSCPVVSTQIYTNLQLSSCFYTNLQLPSCVYTNLHKSAADRLSTQICSCPVVSTQIYTNLQLPSCVYTNLHKSAAPVCYSHSSSSLKSSSHHFVTSHVTSSRSDTPLRSLPHHVVPQTHQCAAATLTNKLHSQFTPFPTTSLCCNLPHPPSTIYSPRSKLLHAIPRSNHTNMNTLAQRYRVLSRKHHYSSSPSVFHLSFQQASSRTQHNLCTHLPQYQMVLLQFDTDAACIKRPPEPPGLLVTHFDLSSCSKGHLHHLAYW